MPLDAAAMSALKERSYWDDTLRHLMENGWPLTKASYLALVYIAEAPEFPLDPEVTSTIPPQLEGKIPRTAEQYWAAWDLAPIPRAPSSPAKT